MECINDECEVEKDEGRPDADISLLVSKCTKRTTRFISVFDIRIIINCTNFFINNALGKIFRYELGIFWSQGRTWDCVTAADTMFKVNVIINSFNCIKKIKNSYFYLHIRYVYNGLYTYFCIPVLSFWTLTHKTSNRLWP